MPRLYTVNFEDESLGAPQDMVQIVGPSAGKVIRVIRCWVMCVDTSLATGQSVRLRMRYLPATVSVGSGGTTGITPSKAEDQGDTACSSTTCATNNTSQATTSGTAVVRWAGGCHLYAGSVFEPPMTRPVVVNPSTAFVWELLSTVSGTVHGSGGVDIEEIG